MAKPTSKKDKETKEVKPLVVVVDKKTGRSKVTMTNGVRFWSHKEVGDSIAGTYIETLEFSNKLDETGKKPFQYKPILETLDGEQVAIPENWKIKRAIEQFGKKYYIITFLGKEKGKGDYKKFSFNTYDVEFLDKAPKK